MGGGGDRTPAPPVPTALNLLNVVPVRDSETEAKIRSNDFLSATKQLYINLTLIGEIPASTNSVGPTKIGRNFRKFKVRKKCQVEIIFQKQ